MQTILVVEDEPGVRSTIVRALQSTGYDVREADSGKTALAALRHGGFDLVLTDVYMPDVDGIELLMQLTTQASPPKVVAMSGGGYLDKKAGLEIASRLGAIRTLEKPFGMAQLLEVVRATLAGGE